SFTLSVIDVASDTVTATVPMPGGPGPIAFKFDGSRAYVGPSPANLTVLDGATNSVLTTAPLQLNTIAGIAITPDGADFYVPDLSTVGVVDSTTFQVSPVISGSANAAGNSNGFIMPTVPAAPTIGSATAGNAQATVSLGVPFTNGASRITGYTAIATPGGASGTGSV